MRLKFKGMRALIRALDPPKWDHEMRVALDKALDRAALRAVKAVRDELKGGGYEANAELTIAIKGSAKPGIDRGQLFQSITFARDGELKRFVGVLKRDNNYDLAAALHNGATINVTDAMRSLFFTLWLASVGRIDPGTLDGRARQLWRRMPGGWKPLKSSTAVIRIPKRPFIENAFKKTDLKKAVREEATKAIAEVLRSRAGEARAGGGDE